MTNWNRQLNRTHHPSMRVAYQFYQRSQAPQPLVSPQQLFFQPQQQDRVRLSRVSTLMQQRGIPFPQLRLTSPPPPPAAPSRNINSLSSSRGIVRPQQLLRPPVNSSLDAQLNYKQEVSVQSAYKEWQSGVRESHGSNRSPRIDQYARNSRFGPGHAWCGFFVSWNYSQAGFKYPQNLASYQKARDFFMYRSYTSRSRETHAKLDDLRAKHQQQGHQRQYFMLEESPNIKYVNNYKRYFGHINAEANTFNYRNLPVRPGDTVLFHHGHVGMVVDYNPQTGQMVTIEGNTTGKGPDGKRRSQAVVRKEWDLKDPDIRAKFDGFGRPARDDFE